MKALYGLLLVPNIVFGSNAVSIFEVTTDSDGFDGYRALIGYEHVTKEWRAGILQGLYYISDNNGDATFHETRGIYKYTVDSRTSVQGFVSALYTKDTHYTDTIGGNTYLNESWTTPIGSISLATRPTDNTYVEAGWEHNIIDTSIAVGNHIFTDTISVSGDYSITNEWTIVGSLAYQHFNLGDLNKHADEIAVDNGYMDGTDAFEDYGIEWNQNLKGSKNIEIFKFIYTPDEVPGLVLQAKAKWFQSDFNFKPGFLNKHHDGYDQFRRGVFWAPDKYQRYMLVAGYSRSFYNDNFVWSASYGYGIQKVNDHYGVGVDKVTYDETHRAEEIILKLRGAITPELYITSYYKQDTDAGKGQPAYRWEEIGVHLEYSF